MHNKYVRILTLVLLVQAVLFWTAARGEHVPHGAPLELFPAQLGAWQETQNYPVEQEIRDQLKADDLLNRAYEDASAEATAGLFVAYFKTQRTGQSPHSPKNCLPGSGWEPEATGSLDVAVAGQPQPIRINRYVVSHGDEESVVLYWYQSERRVIASEFSAKFWLVMDSIRYHRSDTALVRVTVPVFHNDRERATQSAVAFVQALFPALKGYLPS
ncbi:MAG TPA: EpsI family protein [Bryobacteraceae bacterium]|nr:EpsI family protein [Bryobacteraceae bacterium]